MNTSTLFVLGFILLAFVERAVATHRNRHLLAGAQQLRWSLYVFYFFYLAIILGSPVEYFLKQQPLNLPLTALGLLLYVAGCVLRTVAIRTLGKFWSLQIEIRDQHQLIREGIYRHIRHPNYTGIILEVLSIPLVVNAWHILLVATSAHVLFLLIRWHYEEKALVEKFGDQYRAYQQQVGAFLPRWSSSR